MKSLIAILFFMLVYSTSPFAQPDNKISTIRRIVTAINMLSGYKVKTLDNDYFEGKYGGTPDNGIELKGYYQNKVLKKMVYSVGLSNSMKTYEFYMFGANLVFVFLKEQDYPETAGGLDYSKLVPAQEVRYYFDGSKIIKTNIKGKGRPGGIEQADLLSTFNDLKKDIGSYKGK